MLYYTKLWTIFYSDRHFAPLGLGPWGVWHFYTHTAPLGLRIATSAFIFL